MSWKKAVPVLRFPEFHDDWITVKAGSIFGNRVEKGSDELPIYSVTMNDGMVKRSSLDRNIDDIEKSKDNKKVYLGDIAYNMMRMWQGALGVAPEDCMVSPAYVILSPAINVHSIFFATMLKKSRYIHNLTAHSQGLTSDRLRLYYKDFAQIKIPLPSLIEQQKIAGFLSDIDTKIEKLARKKELTNHFKKGAMQKLFSQELRFKDDSGKEFPEWEEKRLGDCGSTFTGLTGKIGEDFGKGSPYITYKTIFDNSVIDISRCERVNVLLGEKQNTVQFGDIFFTVSSETPAEVGIASVLLSEIKEPCYLNSFCFGFRPHNLLALLPSFMRFYLRSPMIRKKIMILAQGSTRYNISKTALINIAIRLPHPEEQKKIAAFLTNLDNKIIAIDYELSMLKEFKRGLLQQMFV